MEPKSNFALVKTNLENTEDVLVVEQFYNQKKNTDMEKSEHLDLRLENNMQKTGSFSAYRKKATTLMDHRNLSINESSTRLLGGNLKESTSNNLNF